MGFAKIPTGEGGREVRQQEAQAAAEAAARTGQVFREGRTAFLGRCGPDAAWTSSGVASAGPLEGRHAVLGGGIVGYRRQDPGLHVLHASLML